MVTPEIHSTKRQFMVVDNFLVDPDAMREFALSQQYEARHSKGVRSVTSFPFDEIYRPCFAELLDVEMTTDDFVKYSNVNGCFQWCSADTPKVIHCDEQSYAGALYLTPDAPVESGTTMYRHRDSKARYKHEHDGDIFHGGFFDETKWEAVDRIGNIYNRLVLWHGKAVHSASVYFGKDIEDSRLFQVFFFNARPK